MQIGLGLLLLSSSLWCIGASQWAFEVMLFCLFDHHLCKGCSMLVISAVQTPQGHWKIPASPHPG